MGMTANKDIPFSSSIVDYVFKYLGLKFLTDEEKVEIFGQAAPANSHQEKMNGMVNGIANGAPAPERKEKMEDRTPEISDIEVQPVLALSEIKPGETENPLCSRCGYIMYRAGTCLLCRNCGEVTGVCS